MLTALTLLWAGCSVASFALGWYARGETIDLDERDADLLREALDAVDAGEVVRIQR